MRIHHALAVVVSLAGFASEVGAQSHTYHLHQENTISYDGLDLRTAGPDAPSTRFSSTVLSTMVGTTTTIRTFQLPSNVPALGGVMPAGTTVTFTLWMRMTADRGVVYPAASVTNMYPGGAWGSIGPYQHYCSGQSTTPLTTTLAPYTFSCTMPQAMPIDPTDRFTLWVSYFTHSFTPKKGKSGGMSIELGIEGVLNGPTDSQIVLTIPGTPRITGVSPATGPSTGLLTINGANFGVAPGASVARVNGMAATPVSWNDSQIVVQLPPGVGRGPVVVVVGSAASNTWMFQGAWDPGVCFAGPSPRILSFPKNSRMKQVSVAAPVDCQWAPLGSPSWLSATPSFATGPNTLDLTTSTLPPNTPPRYAVVSVNGEPIAVQQGETFTPWHSKAHPAPTIALNAQNVATCSLSVADRRLFMGMDLYADGTRVASHVGAGGSFVLTASTPGPASGQSLHCVTFSALNGFVTSEARMLVP